MAVRYGILGAGFMGQEHMRNITFIEGCEVAAFYEPDDEMCKAAAALAPNARIATSLEDLVQANQIDVLVIATPNFQHADQLKQIMNLGPVPILVEKPLVILPEDRQFVQDLQKNYSAPIWVGMEYRYMPPMQRFLAEVEEATGGVKHLSIREHRFPFLSKVDSWNRDNSLSGGTLVEKCCHFFDLMRVITGDDPVRVMGSGWQAVNHLEEADVWDAAFAVVDFAKGTRAMLDLCMFAEGAMWQEEITAIGPKGRIDCLIPTGSRRWPAHLGPHPHAKIVIWPRDKSGKIEIEIPIDRTLAVAGDHHGSTYFQHLAFLEMLKTGKSPQVTLEDGWLAVEMGMAAQTSSETGHSIKITT